MLGKKLTAGQSMTIQVRGTNELQMMMMMMIYCISGYGEMAPTICD